MKETDDFLSDPRLLQHYSLLQDLGLFDYVAALKHEARDFENLLGMAADILSQTNIEALLETTVRCIADRFLPSFLVFLWRPSSAKEEVLVRGYRNFKKAEFPVDLDSLRPFEAFFKRYPGPISYQLLEYQLADPATTDRLDPLGPEIVVPIIGPSGLYGLILVGSKVLEDQYSPAELAFLSRLMNFCSISFQNNLHYQHSVRDPKTGLYNHAYYMVRLDEEIPRSRRSGRPLSVIVMDVDKFKAFNDGYGHLAGDRVLESIAACLSSTLRDEDVVARFGGEEFTVLLPDANREQAWVVAERLRLAVAALRIPWEVALPPVTISAGVAVMRSDAPADPAELLRRADEALYLSKTRGRNRTTVWGAGLLFRSRKVTPSA